MYEITVNAEFCAAHAIEMAGAREKTHGHNWGVSVTLAGPSLDRDGLLCDFHTIETSLHDILARYHNANLNEVEPFDRLNPTAEHVASYLFESLDEALESLGASEVRLQSVAVTEAPGCVAVYRPSKPGAERHREHA